MKKESSFTLIELLIVISMIGLVASIVLVSLRGTRERAQIAVALDFSHSLQHSIGIDAIGVWRLEGNLIDNSGYNNNGTLYGDTQYVDSIEELGKALYFDGLGDYVEIPNSSSLNPQSITIEMWVKQASRHPSAWTYLFYKGNWGSYHIISEDTWLPPRNNQVGFTVRVEGNQQHRLWTEKSLELGQWVHLAFSYDATTGAQRNYWNGALDAEADRTPADMVVNTSPLRINDRFHGTIDEVRVYSRALSATQIKERYLAGLSKHLSFNNNFYDGK